MAEIHDREGQVVKDVCRCDHRVELDRVEQNRLPVDKDDIAKMRVAMAATDQTFRPACLQELAAISELLMAQCVEPLDCLPRKPGFVEEGPGIAFDDARDRF